VAFFAFHEAKANFTPSDNPEVEEDEYQDVARPQQLSDISLSYDEE